MQWGGVGLACAAALAIAGCDLGVGGLFAASAGLGDDGGAPIDSGAPFTGDASGDAHAPFDAGVGGEDDDAGDATTPGDAGPPDAPSVDACTTPVTDAGAVATAIAFKPKIDGDPTDWPCSAAWLSLSTASAAYTSIRGETPSALFAVAYDPGNLYVVAVVTDPNVSGNDGANPYDNDSIEIYLSGDTTLSGDYDANTHQYITDYKGLTVDYGPLHESPAGTQVTNPPHVTAKAKLVTGGYAVEVQITKDALGFASFGANESVRFDFSLNDGDGTGQQTIVMWGDSSIGTCSCVANGCCCGDSPDLPYCDSTRFGTLQLK